VIHVVTVHWQDDRWIDPQLHYLERNVDDLRVYASLDGIDRSHASKFFYACELDGTHPEKLNALAEVVREHAAADDLLLFLDGDAFPIAPVTRAVLDGKPLAAVRRDENAGQQLPHPSFCLTTVGFWFDIEGDWREGYTWTAPNGDELTDVGGNLFGILTERRIEWRPLLRSNRVDLDPLWFGVYADLVYHHGAGFRDPVSFIQMQQAVESRRQAVRDARIPIWVPVAGRAERSVRYRLARRRAERDVDTNAARSQTLSDEVFGWILEDDEFYRRFV
jgi:hypothetical protein